MTKRSLRSLHSNKSGAALVEFLVALMPLMITFSSFVQLQQMATARLVLKHSAVVGARAASVIANKNKNTPEQEQGDNQAVVQKGVEKALGPWAQTMTVTTTIQDDSTCADPYGMVTVRVQAQYKCQVPFGGRLVCGLGGMHDFNNIKYAMPHQGARYKDGGGASCK